MNAAERLRVYGPPGYLSWIHEQPCRLCGAVPSEDHPTQCCHLAGPGTGSGTSRKADWTFSFPGCMKCHNLIHAGRSPVGKSYLVMCAEFTQAAWREHQNLKPPRRAV